MKSQSGERRRYTSRATQSSSARCSLARENKLTDTDSDISDNDPSGCFPAITHFTDCMAAIPKEVARFLTQLHEVEAKSLAPSNKLHEIIESLNTLFECETVSRSNFHAYLSSSRSLFPEKSTQVSSTSPCHHSSSQLKQTLDDDNLSLDNPANKSPSIPRSEIHRDRPSATTTIEIAGARMNDLFSQMSVNLNELSPFLDEKIAVLRNANKTMSRHIQRVMSSYPYIANEISEEARLGSLTHWALHNEGDKCDKVRWEDDCSRTPEVGSSGHNSVEARRDWCREFTGTTKRNHVTGTASNDYEADEQCTTSKKSTVKKSRRYTDNTVAETKCMNNSSLPLSVPAVKRRKTERDSGGGRGGASVRGGNSGIGMKSHTNDELNSNVGTAEVSAIGTGLVAHTVGTANSTAVSTGGNKSTDTASSPTLLMGDVNRKRVRSSLYTNRKKGASSTPTPAPASTMMNEITMGRNQYSPTLMGNTNSGRDVNLVQGKPKPVQGCSNFHSGTGMDSRVEGSLNIVEGGTVERINHLGESREVISDYEDETRARMAAVMYGSISQRKGQQCNDEGRKCTEEVRVRKDNSRESETGTVVMNKVTNEQLDQRRMHTGGVVTRTGRVTKDSTPPSVVGAAPLVVSGSEGMSGSARIASKSEEDGKNSEDASVMLKPPDVMSTGSVSQGIDEEVMTGVSEGGKGMDKVMGVQNEHCEILERLDLLKEGRGDGREILEASGIGAIPVTISTLAQVQTQTRAQEQVQAQAQAQVPVLDVPMNGKEESLGMSLILEDGTTGGRGSTLGQKRGIKRFASNIGMTKDEEQMLPNLKATVPGIRKYNSEGKIMEQQDKGNMNIACQSSLRNEENGNREMIKPRHETDVKNREILPSWETTSTITKKNPFADEATENVDIGDGEENEGEIDVDEPRYCYCNQVSYGEMVACDNDNCTREWFHLKCAGLKEAPTESTKWYCSECMTLMEIPQKGQATPQALRP